MSKAAAWGPLAACGKEGSILPSFLPPHLTTTTNHPAPTPLLYHHPETPLPSTSLPPLPPPPTNDMTTKRAKPAATADLDQLFEGIGDDNAAPKKAAKSKAGAAKGIAEAEEDILAELENQLGEKAAVTPHTRRASRTPPPRARRPGAPPRARRPPPPTTSRPTRPASRAESTRSFSTPASRPAPPAPTCRSRRSGAPSSRPRPRPRPKPSPSPSWRLVGRASSPRPRPP